MDSKEGIALKLAQAFESKNEKLTELRIVVDACPLATFITNNWGDCLYVNAEYQILVGHPYQDLLGNGWKKIIHPEDAESITAFWASSISNASSFEHTYRYVRPDGNIIPVHCKAVKLPSMGYVGYVNATDGIHCRFICQARYAGYAQHVAVAV